MGHPDLVRLVLSAEPARHANEIVDREVVDPARISPIHNGPARFAVYKIEHTNLVVRAERALCCLSECGRVGGDAGFHGGGHEAITTHVTLLGSCGSRCNALPAPSHATSRRNVRAPRPRERLSTCIVPATETLAIIRPVTSEKNTVSTANIDLVRRLLLVCPGRSRKPPAYRHDRGRG